MMRFHKLLTKLLLAAILFAGVPLAVAEQVISPEDLQQWREDDRPHLLIDVRPATLFERGHLMGAMNIPAQLLPHKKFPEDQDLVLYDNDLSGKTAREAAESLEDMDDSRIYVLRGGLRAWEKKGLASVRPMGMYDASLEKIITGEDLLEGLRTGMALRIVDIRDEKSFRKKSIPGAINVPLIKSAEELKKVKTDVFEKIVDLPKESKAKLNKDNKSSRPSAVPQLLAEEITSSVEKHAADRKKAGKPVPQGPVVLIDHGGGISRKISPHMKRAGMKDVLVLERGYIGWMVANGTLPERTSKSLFHGSSSFTPSQVAPDGEQDEEKAEEKE